MIIDTKMNRTLTVTFSEHGETKATVVLSETTASAKIHPFAFDAGNAWYAANELRNYAAAVIRLADKVQYEGKVHGL